MAFRTFGLSDPLVQGILATGYTAPTEIQSRAIPAAIAGGDIIGCAQTGTGKTAAFVLPLLDRLSRQNGSRKQPAIRSLILTPTRELAVQIERSVNGYGRFLNLKTQAVYGGVSIDNQISALRRGVDIVVATPGRLIDHIERGTINLGSVSVLVLDEADRMLDMGFINDVRRIVGSLPQKRQTLLFSATISPEVRSMAGNMLQSPTVIQIGRPRNPIDTISQHFYEVDKSQKMDLLLRIINDWQMYSVLVFSRTKYGADKISRKLKKAGLVAVSIHSDRTQNQRQRALDGFRSGRYHIMVATDIAARGIDVEGISHVINYDVPTHAEDYVHRIGRTGRAAATGDAITFVSSEERKYLQSVGKFIGRKIKTQKCEGLSPTRAACPGQKTAASSRTRTTVAEQANQSNSRVKKARHGRRKRNKRRNQPQYC